MKKCVNKFHDGFNILLVTINVIGIVNITATNGAKLLLIWNHSININIKDVDDNTLTTCVSGKRINLAKVGFTWYVIYEFKKNEPMKLLEKPIICAKK